MADKILQFFYEEDGAVHNIEEINERYEADRGVINEYHGRILCPECREALLSYTPKSSSHRAYLSKIPTSNHAPECSLQFEYVAKRRIKEYIETLNAQQIQDRLEAALRYLINQEGNFGGFNGGGINNNPLVIPANRQDAVGGYRTIPRKSIRADFSEEDAGKVYVFYGTVRLAVEEFEEKNTNAKRYRLTVCVYRNGAWMEKLKIYRGARRDEVNENMDYNLAVLGELGFRYGLQIKTITWDAVAFEEA